MTKEDFNRRTNEEFSLQEQALINTNIYYNPKYIEYYQNYHMGRYSDCFDFLIRHRNLLKLKHTPKEFKSTAEQILNGLKAKDEPILLVRGRDNEVYLIDDPEMIFELEEIFAQFPEEDALNMVLPIINPEKYGDGKRV